MRKNLLPAVKKLDNLKSMETNYPKRTGHLVIAWRKDGKVDAFPSQTLQEHCAKLETLRSDGEYTFLEEFRSPKSHRRESLSHA